MFNITFRIGEKAKTMEWTQKFKELGHPFFRHCILAKKCKL